MTEQIPQELFYTWISEFINQNDIHDFTGHEAAFAVYIAEKACEWQRERDAQICDAQALEPECPERARYCAEAIRKGSE